MTNEEAGHNFIRVHSVLRPHDLALIKSILESSQIPYFIKGENFGSLYGPADGLSMMDVMVQEKYFEQAKELLKDFITPRP